MTFNPYMMLVANFANAKWCKKELKNDWNPGIWILIWEYSARAIQWIPTWQGIEGFQKFYVLFLWTKMASALEGFNRLIQYHESWDYCVICLQDCALLVSGARVELRVRCLMPPPCTLIMAPAHLVGTAPRAPRHPCSVTPAPWETSQVSHVILEILLSLLRFFHF